MEKEEASSLLRSGEYPCSQGWLWKNSVDQLFISLDVDSTSVELCVCVCTHRVRFYSSGLSEDDTLSGKGVGICSRTWLHMGITQEVKNKQKATNISVSP